MILRELFYVDNDKKTLSNDMRYEPHRYKTAISKNDTRKTRLTLGQINQLRKTSEAHILEQEQELQFVKIMYGAPPPAPQ